MARWTEPRPHARADIGWFDLFCMAAGVALFFSMIILLGWFLFGLPAGAQQLEQDCTRPYHNLTPEQLPNICTVQFDGDGHATLAGFNPDSGLVWHAATFHIPNPDNWPDQTVTVDTTLPAGPFNLTLACEAGAAQVDVWLEGQDDAYVAATTLDCAGPCYLNIAVSAPDARTSVSERHDDAPCGAANAADGAPGEQTGPADGSPVLSAATHATPTNPPPVDAASSEAETATVPPGAVSASAATTLPNTGIDIRWFLLAGTGCLVAAMVLILVGPHIFRGKGRRS